MWTKETEKEIENACSIIEQEIANGTRREIPWEDGMPGDQHGSHATGYEIYDPIISEELGAPVWFTEFEGDSTDPFRDIVYERTQK